MGQEVQSKLCYAGHTLCWSQRALRIHTLISLWKTRPIGVSVKIWKISAIWLNQDILITSKRRVGVTKAANELVALWSSQIVGYHFIPYSGGHKRSYPFVKVNMAPSTPHPHMTLLLLRYFSCCPILFSALESDTKWIRDWSAECAVADLCLRGRQGLLADLKWRPEMGCPAATRLLARDMP